MRTLLGTLALAVFAAALGASAVPDHIDLMPFWASVAVLAAGAWVVGTPAVTSRVDLLMPFADRVEQLLSEGRALMERGTQAPDDISPAALRELRVAAMTWAAKADDAVTRHAGPRRIDYFEGLPLAIPMEPWRDGVLVFINSRVIRLVVVVRQW